MSLRHGVLQQLWVDLCSRVDTHGLLGGILPYHGLQQRLQGKLCSGTWSTSPSFFVDLAIYRIVSFTYSHSSLWLQLCRCFCPFLNLLSQCCWWDQPWPAVGPSLETIGVGFIRQQGKLPAGSIEASPVVPPPPKPCHTNPVSMDRYQGIKYINNITKYVIGTSNLVSTSVWSLWSLLLCYSN